MFQISWPGGRSAGSPPIAVVSAAYKVAARVAEVIAWFLLDVCHITGVNDASPGGMTDTQACIDERRPIMLDHAQGRGSGGVMKTGKLNDLGFGASARSRLHVNNQAHAGPGRRCFRLRSTRTSWPRAVA